MPELPEVETTARLLEPDLVGRRIRGVDVRWPRTLGGQSEHALREGLVGARITTAGRRAKYLVFDLERGRRPAGYLVVHLRMSGRLFVAPARAAESSHLRVRLSLDRGVLDFDDVRKFGRFFFAADRDAVFASLGPEPLGDELDAASFGRALRSRKRMLKPLLLDQTFLAGLGNIYVDESLFRSGLHPLRRSDRVPQAAAGRLFEEIRATLNEAIAREGSSFDSFYRTPTGQPGSYQHQFLVYGRDGRPCLRCGRTLVKIVVGQRGTHFCTRCQPAPRQRG